MIAIASVIIASELEHYNEQDQMHRKANAKWLCLSVSVSLTPNQEMQFAIK
jgi:hypothetical protein